MVVLGLMASVAASSANSADFGPSNPFYAASTLPFGAPPFDKIKDADYQPAIEAGMAQQLAEINKIADNPAAPTFENTLVAMERSGRLLARASAAFNGVNQANTNPVLQKAKTALAPQIAAHQDAIRLNKKLFERIAAALAPGAPICVLDVYERPEGRRPDSASFLGLFFLLTSGADTYTIHEVSQWLREAGFGAVKSRRLIQLPGLALLRAERA